MAPISPFRGERFSQGSIKFEYKGGQMTKMFRHARRFGMVAMAILLSGALLLGSVVPAKAAEERLVKIGNLAAMTGALSTSFLPGIQGERDYTTWVNDHGGIDGIKISHLWEDTKAMIPKAIMAFRRFKEAGVVAVFDIDVGCVLALLPSYERERIPCIWINAHVPGTITKPQWNFAAFPGWNGVGLAYSKWIKENWTGADLPRVGVIFQDVAAGWDMCDGFKLAADQGYCQLVGYEVVPLFGAIDTSVEWLRLSSKKPDWICVEVYGATAVTCIKDAYRLEIQRKGIELAATPLVLAENYIYKIIGPKQCEGWYKFEANASPRDSEADVPGIRNVNEAAKKYRGREPDDSTMLYVMGWVHGMVMIEAIRLAIEKVGFDDLTGEAVRDVLASGIIKDFDTGGLCRAITVSEREPCFLHALKPYQIVKGKMVSIGDYVEVPFLHAAK